MKHTLKGWLVDNTVPVDNKEDNAQHPPGQIRQDYRPRHPRRRIATEIG